MRTDAHRRTAQSALLLARLWPPSRPLPSSLTGRWAGPAAGRGMALWLRCAETLYLDTEGRFHPRREDRFAAAAPRRRSDQAASFRRCFYGDSGPRGSRSGPFLCRVTAKCLVTCTIYELNNRSLTLELGRIWKYCKDKLLSKSCWKWCFPAPAAGSKAGGGA